MGTSVFLSSGDGYVREILELHQGCQGPFQGSRGKVGFLLRRHSGKGPHLTLRGESHVFSQVAAGNMGFLSSSDGDLRDQIVLPQESPVSMRVAWSLLGFLSSQYQCIGPHLELRPEPQGSSPVLTWISGFLWSFNRGVRPRFMWRLGTLLSFRVVKWGSVLLSRSGRKSGFFQEDQQGRQASYHVVRGHSVFHWSW